MGESKKEEKVDVSKVKDIVNNLANTSKIFEGEFESITYYWGGDYEGKTYEVKDNKIVYTRVSENEIVGKLRWFLRTVLARFVGSNLNSYEEVEECLYFLGTTSDQALKSDYEFRVKLISPGDKIRNVNLEDLDRVRIGMMGRDKSKEQLLPIDNVKFKLEVYKLKENNQVKNCVSSRDFLVVGGVLLTLAYIGIGKAANRGFGRFYPKNIEDKIAGLKELKEKIIGGDVRGAFNHYYTTLGFDEKKGNDWRKSKIPLAPLTSVPIEKGGIYIYEQKVDEYKSMLCCNKVVLKSSWKIHWHGRIRDSGVKIHTWLFGLPRNVKGKTGYLAKGIDRRVSPIVLSPIKLPDNEYKIAVLPFLSSKDFKEELLDKGLEHVGTRRVKVVDLLDQNKIDKILRNSEKRAPPRDLKFVTGSVDSLIENYLRELPNVLSEVCATASSTQKRPPSQQSKGHRYRGQRF